MEYLDSDHTLTYDGTFDGFLTCVFHVFELKLDTVAFQKQNLVQQSLFGDATKIDTAIPKADRAWKGINKKISRQGGLQLYYAFLSEKDNIEILLLEYIRQIFINQLAIDKDFSNPLVLKIAQIAKSVGREKHRMEAFVRFRLTKDEIYFATISPDFDVLPLISKHFKSRYADQQWIIYDIKRNYGLYYNLEMVEIITMDLPEAFDATKTSTEFFTDSEIEFQTLWQNYFGATNISERKNMKLHVQHVPKRYWKYLSEKLG